LQFLTIENIVLDVEKTGQLKKQFLKGAVQRAEPTII
jgi:hypothetical protein